MGWGKWVGAFLTALMLVVGASGTSFADLRIVSEYDTDLSEVLVKGRRIVSRSSPGEWFMIDCRREELTYVFHNYYWQGSVSEFAAGLEQELGSLLNVEEDIGSEEVPAEVLAFLGGLLGPSTAGDVQVRVTEIGNDTVAGYKATQYRVETGDGTKWKTHEIISISGDLLREIEAEVGNCAHLMVDVAQQMAALVPIGDTPIVYSDPGYQALVKQGFPVRSITTMSMFGIEIDVETSVIEVSKAPLSEEDFTVPDSLKKVDDLSFFFRD